MKISITVAIPSYELNDSLVMALESLYAQSAYEKISSILLVTDGKEIPESVLNKIRNPKLRIIRNLRRLGQTERLNDIFRIVKTDVLILTNDDVFLDKFAISRLLYKYEETKTDLISGNEIPFNNLKFINRVLNSGYNISRIIQTDWNNGDNYLACNGRLLLMSLRLYKSISIPSTLWNNDVYIYLFTKYKNYKFVFDEEAKCYYISPNSVSEYVNQSVKFQGAIREITGKILLQTEPFWKIPFLLKIRAYLVYFLRSPLFSFAYLITFAYSRMMKHLKINSFSRTGYWETDKSTKNLNSIYET